MLDFRFGLRGFFGSFADGKQVKVSGFSENYVIKKSFPLLVADNSFTMVYLLQSTVKSHIGLFVPEAFLSLADKDVEVAEGAIFDELNFKLNGFFGSFLDGEYVKLKDSDKIYKVASSFLMLNSATSSIICYELTDVNDKLTFFCPHSFLVRTFAPDVIQNSGPGGGGNPGGSGDNGSPGHGDGSGFYG